MQFFVWRTGGQLFSCPDSGLDTFGKIELLGAVEDSESGHENRGQLTCKPLKAWLIRDSQSR